MPSLGFVLPHWLYWSGLAFFPLIAWYLTRRQLRRPPDAKPSLFIAYFFLALAGYLGIHRFYLRSGWGIIFIPVFLAILYCNSQVAEVRDETSRTFAAMEAAKTAVDVAKPAEDTNPDAKAEYERAVSEHKARTGEYQTALAVTDHWKRMASRAALLLAAMLAVDAVLLPWLVRRRRVVEVSAPTRALPTEAIVDDVHEGGVGQDPTRRVHSRFTDVIDRANALAGEYVAWWAVIAVFVYYYEVAARYFFNSPTNWVHESMFLMFGMQYMMSGAFAYREDQHVRVDVFYARFSERGKAIADIVTSIFFFIFIGTMLWTGARFAMDAVQVGEHSFTEWGIQYWPVKLAIPVGAALLLLQGVSKLIKDILIVSRKVA